MPTKKQNKTKEVIDKVFGDPETSYGLKEFENVDFEKALEITENEKNRFYIKDLKSGKERFVYDESKNNGKPEEIVRQLWIHRLNKQYKYPLDRIVTEKDIYFGREIHSNESFGTAHKKIGKYYK